MPLSSLLSGESISSIERLISSPPPVMLILESPLAGLPELVAEHLAAAWIEDEAALDLVVQSPDGDRWTVSEVETKIIDRSRLIPFERNMIVVSSASAMDLAAAEKVLKTVEEPPTPTTFLFCVPTSGELSTTLRGRAGSIIHLTPASPETRAQALVEAGAKPTDAKEAVAVAGNQVKLAPLLARDESLLRLAKSSFSVDLKSSTPFGRAAATTESLSALANALSSDGEKKTSDKLSPTARASLRILTRELIERHRQAVAKVIPNLSRAEDFERALRILKAADAAELQISRYTSIELALEGFFTSFA